MPLAGRTASSRLYPLKSMPLGRNNDDMVRPITLVFAALRPAIPPSSVRGESRRPKRHSSGEAFLRLLSNDGVSESDVLRRQAEFGAGKHGCGTLHVVGGMRL